MGIGEGGVKVRPYCSCSALEDDTNKSKLTAQGHHFCIQHSCIVSEDLC